MSDKKSVKRVIRTVSRPETALNIDHEVFDKNFENIDWSDDSEMERKKKRAEEKLKRDAEVAEKSKRFPAVQIKADVDPFWEPPMKTVFR